VRDELQVKRTRSTIVNHEESTECGLFEVKGGGIATVSTPRSAGSLFECASMVYTS
jgi:hypothetical protein